MSWLEQVFNYCERGLDPSFWAEPVNAVTNAAFLMAAGAAALRLRGQPVDQHWAAPRERVVLWLLILMVVAIGIGSFLFHTFATRWALVADVAPITAFMIAYLGYALRAFLGLPWLAVLAVLVAFLYAGELASRVTCAAQEIAGGAVGASGLEPCLNGSLGYLPALVSLLVIGLLIERRGLVAGRKLLLAGVIFLVSVVLRTIDRDICEATHVMGQVRGTHALWHVLNATTLYLLLVAAIERTLPTGSSRSAGR